MPGNNVGGGHGAPVSSRTAADTHARSARSAKPGELIVNHEAAEEEEGGEGAARASQVRCRCRPVLCDGGCLLAELWF
jgi:hypothetical protein